MYLVYVFKHCSNTSSLVLTPYCSNTLVRVLTPTLKATFCSNVRRETLATLLVTPRERAAIVNGCMTAHVPCVRPRHSHRCF